ncbi:putative holin [Neisseria meningitidis]|uniref:putative holin n=1 Tax=Neisseria meningitidis TaxID=487 RepID=UPI000E5958EB|nr:putative holin [Neisseria meningitidis]
MGLTVLQDKTTTAVNAAVIVIGSYHVHASVAFGALIGASLFILSENAAAPLNKAWLFAVSFIGGIFGYSDAEEIINWAILGNHLHINSFTAAAVISALLVIAIRRLMRLVARQEIPGRRAQTKGDAEQ